MIRNSGVLTREDNRISLVSARRATTQEGYVAITERAIPVNTIEQSWIFEAGEMVHAGRTTPRLPNILVEIIQWLNHVGSRRMGDSRLEARPPIPHNYIIKSIGL